MAGKFWLDGGYDRDLVEGCRLHPEHGWITLRLGDVLGEEYRWPDEKMTVCRVRAEKAEAELATVKRIEEMSLSELYAEAAV